MAKRKRMLAARNVKTERVLGDLLYTALIAELTIGVPSEEIASRYSVSVRYVDSVRTQFLKATRLQEAFDYKQDLKLRAINAIRAGLDSKKNPYARARIGVDTMKGIGEFTPDSGATFNLYQHIQNAPPEFQSRYITNQLPSGDGLGHIADQAPAIIDIQPESITQSNSQPEEYIPLLAGGHGHTKT